MNRVRSIIAAVAAAGLLVLLLAGQRLEEWPTTGGERERSDAFVTNGDDGGRGSLRDALYTAARSSSRFLIRVKVDRIRVQTPLPPLSNPAGIVLAPDVEGGRFTLEATDGPGAVVLDIAAPSTLVRGVTIIGASGLAIQVRAANVELDGVQVRDSEIGVSASEDAHQLRIRSGSFVANRIGVQLAAGTVDANLHDNSFQGHSGAAIWQVAPMPRAGGGSRIHRNSFVGDRRAMVLLNVGVTIEDNTIRDTGESAILLSGSRAVVRSNRMTTAGFHGVMAASMVGATLVGNEIDNCGAAGILLLGCADTRIRDNRLQRNVYGIGDVLAGTPPNVLSANHLIDHRADAIYLLGASPLVTGNWLQESQQYGVRILDFDDDESIRKSMPYLANNHYRGNGLGDDIRGVFRLVPPVDGPSDVDG